MLISQLATISQCFIWKKGSFGCTSSTAPLLFYSINHSTCFVLDPVCLPSLHLIPSLPQLSPFCFHLFPFHPPSCFYSLLHLLFPSSCQQLLSSTPEPPVSLSSLLHTMFHCFPFPLLFFPHISVRFLLPLHCPHPPPYLLSSHLFFPART